MKLQVIVASKSEYKVLSKQQITPIGGVNSSGLTLTSLQYKDDYCIFTPTKQKLRLHILRGKQQGKAIDIKDPGLITIDDLTVLFLEQTDSVTEDKVQLNQLAANLTKLCNYTEIRPALESVLQQMLQSFSFDKGIVIAKKNKDDFEVKVQVGVEDKSWLSDSLVNQVLKSQEPVFIHNVYGSEYRHNKSIQASKFLAVFAWPLCFQGESLGVVVLGATKPHSGLNQNEQSFANALIAVASLSFYFFLRNQQQEEIISRLQDKEAFVDCPIVTGDEKLREVCAIAEQVSTTDIGVLIQGETGVGKEVLANWIHKSSNRRDKSFVAINCGAIPSELLESILFGHSKGSFTGAHKDQIGKFQQAQGGTIFLDEIGDLPSHMQVKLLRVLQEREVEPIGAEKPVPIDVRVIAASHKDLQLLANDGKFREDLLYRLAEISLLIPPLRERPVDIVVLAQHFLSLESEEKSFSPAAWTWLKTQPWLGNVRELKSAIRRAVILTQTNEIKVSDFTKGSLAQSQKSATQMEESWLGADNLERAKQRFVFAKVKKALELSKGKRKEAANLLGITPRTLFRYLDDMNGEQELQQEQ